MTLSNRSKCLMLKSWLSVRYCGSTVALIFPESFSTLTFASRSVSKWLVLFTRLMRMLRAIHWSLRVCLVVAARWSRWSILWWSLCASLVCSTCLSWRARSITQRLIPRSTTMIARRLWNCWESLLRFNLLLFAVHSLAEWLFWSLNSIRPLIMVWLLVLVAVLPMRIWIRWCETRVRSFSHVSLNSMLLYSLQSLRSGRAFATIFKANRKIIIFLNEFLNLCFYQAVLVVKHPDVGFKSFRLLQ